MLSLLLLAIQQQSLIYEGKGIDTLKDQITLSGLAFLWLFSEFSLFRVRCGGPPVSTSGVELWRELHSQLPISLVSEENRDVYSPVLSQLVRGT